MSEFAMSQVIQFGRPGWRGLWDHFVGLLHGRPIPSVPFKATITVHFFHVEGSKVTIDHCSLEIEQLR